MLEFLRYFKLYFMDFLQLKIDFILQEAKKSDNCG
jgi:hypothetical protein